MPVITIGGISQRLSREDQLVLEKKLLGFVSTLELPSVRPDHVLCRFPHDFKPIISQAEVVVDLADFYESTKDSDRLRYTLAMGTIAHVREYFGQKAFIECRTLPANVVKIAQALCLNS